MRNFINIVESRIQDIDYEDMKDRVIAKLKGRDSEKYTKLGQKIQKIDTLKKEIKELQDEVKAATRSDIAELFDAADIVKTRVVETLSLIFTLSKVPEPSKNPKYKDILAEIEKDLTPDLLKKLEKLKETMVTIVEKEPGLKVTHLKENKLSSFFSKLKNYFINWGKEYDEKLNALKAEAGLI